MEDAEAMQPARTSKLWTVVWIVYAPLLLLFLSMPNQVVGRLDDLPSTPLVRGIQQAAIAVTEASDSVGIELFYKSLRARFLAAAGIAGG